VSPDAKNQTSPNSVWRRKKADQTNDKPRQQEPGRDLPSPAGAFSREGGFELQRFTASITLMPWRGFPASVVVRGLRRSPRPLGRVPAVASASLLNCLGFWILRMEDCAGARIDP